MSSSQEKMLHLHNLTHMSKMPSVTRVTVQLALRTAVGKLLNSCASAILSPQLHGGTLPLSLVQRDESLLPGQTRIALPQSQAGRFDSAKTPWVYLKCGQRNTKPKSIIKVHEDANVCFNLKMEMVPAGIQQIPNIQFLCAMYLEISC